MPCPTTCKRHFERTCPQSDRYRAAPDAGDRRDLYAVYYREVHISTHRGCCAHNACLAAYYLDADSPHNLPQPRRG